MIIWYNIIDIYMKKINYWRRNNKNE